MRAADSEDGNRTLSHLGELQAGIFAEQLIRTGTPPFDYVLAAAGEADSRLTVTTLQEKVGAKGFGFLRKLALPESSTPAGAEIQELLRKFPDQPLNAFKGENAFQALWRHSLHARREIRGFYSVKQHQRILVCARNNCIISGLASYWASEMVLAGFKICSNRAIPTREDVCFAADEFVLENGQGLQLRFDASDEHSFQVAPITRILPAT
ncbi:MAG: hypothetical protein WCO79_02070 [bacterium]